MLMNKKTGELVETANKVLIIAGAVITIIKAFSKDKK